jgi:hypothetical protein
MTRKIYRTAQGKTVDLGALQLQNENVRAVGNMNVNARGDLVDASNRSIDSKTQQVNRQYRKQASNVVNEPTSKVTTQVTPAKAPAVSVPTPPEDFDDNFEKSATTETAPTETEGGLAAAIARARSIRQEPIEPLNNQTGITRI